MELAPKGSTLWNMILISNKKKLKTPKNLRGAVENMLILPPAIMTSSMTGLLVC